MVKDADGLLFSDDDLTAGAGSALDTDGSAVEIGRTGLHRNSQMVMDVETPDANRNLTGQVELTVDGGTTWEVVGTLTFLAGFAGRRVADIGRELKWERYTNENIQVRANVSSPTNGNAGDWDSVTIHIGYGETEVYGRADTADTIAGA